MPVPGLNTASTTKVKIQKLNFYKFGFSQTKKNVTPRYDQIKLNEADRKNKLQQILSPNADDEGVWIHQNAWFHLGNFDKGTKSDYQLKNENNGVYAFVIKGSFKIETHELAERDGLGIWNTNHLKIEALSTDSELLLMEVPMTI